MDMFISRRVPGITRWLQERSEWQRWSIVLGLFLPFCVTEVVVGLGEDSWLLIIDALHAAIDSAAIISVLLLAILGPLLANARQWRRSVERIVVWSLALFVPLALTQAIYCLIYPELTNGFVVMGIAFAAAVANVLQHWVRNTAPEHAKDDQHHGMMAHIKADLVSNFGVMAGGLVTEAFKLFSLPSAVYLRVDPACSIVLAVYVARLVYKLLTGKKAGCGHT